MTSVIPPLDSVRAAPLLIARGDGDTQKHRVAT